MDGKLIYICCKRENISKALNKCRKSNPQNVYRTIVDVDKCCSIKPVDIKESSYRTKEEWFDWCVGRMDVVWIVDDGYNASVEKHIARKYNIPVAHIKI